MLNGAEYGPYRTHEPVLAAVVAATAGDVLEIGAGTFSTPLLHAICAAMGRRLVTVDNDAGCIEKFGSLASGTHSLHAVASWTDALPLFASSWGVAFVDHAPIERRIVDIEFLSRRCDALVVHDSEDPVYRYEPTFAKFKYRVDYKRMAPWTTVLSNRMDLSIFRDL